MDIKNLKPNSKSKFKQGYFDQYNPKKYFGKRPIIYRSSWELSFMLKMEANNLVEAWTSEEIIIPYLMKEKINGKFILKRHNYHTDFSVIMKSGIKIVVEVKPLSQAPKTEKEIHKNPVIYKNACKWRAAIEWCKANGYIFKVITEEHLKTKVF